MIQVIIADDIIFRMTSDMMANDMCSVSSPVLCLRCCCCPTLVHNCKMLGLHLWCSVPSFTDSSSSTCLGFGV